MQYYPIQPGIPVDKYVRLEENPEFPGNIFYAFEVEISKEEYKKLQVIEGERIRQEKAKFLEAAADAGVKVAMVDGSTIPIQEWCEEE